MTTSEKILRELDAEPWQTMAVLADALDDEGDAEAADGMRILVERQLYPVRGHNGWGWTNPANAVLHSLAGTCVLPDAVWNDDAISREAAVSQSAPAAYARWDEATQRMVVDAEMVTTTTQAVRVPLQFPAASAALMAASRVIGRTP